MSALVRLLCAALALGLATRAEAAPVWEGAPFSADPAALLKDAQAVPAPDGEDIEVLHEEVALSIDDQGRRTTTTRMVYRVVTDQGARSWGTSSVNWAPWYQEAPVLRARVIGADGRVSSLDPATLSEAPAVEPAPDNFSDRRVLRGPLPGIGVGAVVEEVATHREHRTFFESGTTWRVGLSRPVLTQRLVVTVEAPAKLPMRLEIRGLAAKPVRQDRDGRRRYVLDLANVPKRASREPFTPPELVDQPYLGVSTGESWDKVAAAYGKVVDAQLAGAKLDEIFKGVGKLPKDRLAAARTLAAWIHEHLRYTGVELGEAALVPRTPQEVLTRQYGDCKDLAALLVALLRQSGMQANVALLATGWAEIDPELPGLGDFNHAIVYMPGNPAIWIDPTDGVTPAGELPALDQAKHALIAGRTSPALLRTPEARPQDNASRVKREYLLSELGPARIVETRESTGGLAAQVRESWLTTDDDELRDFQRRYCDSAFLSPDVEAFDHSDPRVLDKPATVRLEVAAGKRGFTDEQEAAAALLPLSLFSWLPQPLLPGGEDESKREKRQGEVWLPDPFVAELRFRVVPPAGYAPRALPDDAALTKDLGVARFTRSAKIDASGTIEALFKFEIVRRRWTAAETEALRDGIAELQHDGGLSVTFERTAAALSTEGKIREALAEYDRLIKLHPHEAIHRAQRAEALLEAGFGEAAREEARKAVTLDPKSAFARQKLGYALLHDSMGRLMRKGFDYAGAVEAYRTAKDLEPDNYFARRNLAVLLEYDAEGKRYAKGAHLDEAVVEYRAIRDQLKRNDLDQSLLVALFRAGRFAEAREVAKSMAQSRERDVLMIAAAAAQDGANGGLKEAKRLAPTREARRPVLEAASLPLLTQRHYAEAAALLSEAAPGATNEAELRTRADMLARAVPAERIPLPDSEPATALKRLMLAAFNEETDKLAQVLSPTLASGDKLKEFTSGFSSVMVALRRNLEQASMPGEAVADITLANLKVIVEGDDKLGYRLRASVPGGGGPDTTWFAVREGKRYLLVATADAPWTIGAEALRRLRLGDLAGCRRWLEWSGQTNHLGVPSPASASAEQLRHAAAMLASEGSDLSTPELEQLQKTAKDPEERRGLLLALANAYLSANRWAEALTALDQQTDWGKQSDLVLGLKMLALRKLERVPDLQKVIDERLRADPNDEVALEGEFQLDGERGDFAAAGRAGRKMAELGKANPWIFNDLAWQSLFDGTVGTQALEDAKRANELTKNRRRAMLHTLAAVQAELGKSGEARQTLLRSIDAGSGEPEEHDWYVMGRIAENYGLEELARQAYLKMTQPQKPMPSDTFVLAKRRLDRLGGRIDAKDLRH